MSILDMLARAETSSDLKHHEYACAVDTLGAVGMAAIRDPGHLAIFRVKYLSDRADIPTAKAIFILWARRAMIRRGVNPAGASRLGVQVFMKWLDDICQPCGGLGYPLLEGTPTLSSKPCAKCKGSGHNHITHRGDIGEVMRDIVERADDAVRAIQFQIGRKLGDG